MFLSVMMLGHISSTCKYCNYTDVQFGIMYIYNNLLMLEFHHLILWERERANEIYAIIWLEKSYK